MRGGMEDRPGYPAARAVKARAVGNLALAVLVTATLSGEASAQMGGKRGRRGSQDGSPKASQREGVDLYYATAEELRADLKLSADQAPLWDTYTRKIEALKADIARQRARSRAAAQPSDAPHELDRLTDAQRDRLAALEDIADAGRALYRTLDAAQKIIADARLAKLVATATDATSSPSASRPSSPDRPPD